MFGGGLTIAEEDAPRHYLELYGRDDTAPILVGFLSENGRNVYVRYPVYDESGGAAREYVDVARIERIEIGSKSTQGYERHPMKVFLKGESIPVSGWLGSGFLVSDSGRMLPVYRIEGPAILKRQDATDPGKSAECIKKDIGDSADAAGIVGHEQDSISAEWWKRYHWDGGHTREHKSGEVFVSALPVPTSAE